LVLGLFLFLWINLPQSVSDVMRSIAVRPFNSKTAESNSTDLARLQIENQKLRSQIDHAYEWVLFGQRLGEQFEILKGQRDFSENRAAHLRELLVGQLSSLPAQVIYRDPSSWSSSLWINVGEENNQTVGACVVEKNSPVLSGGALVGVVDYVGKRQSRVRLITDSGLSPSVRVNRGAVRDRELEHQLQALTHQLDMRDDFFPTDDEKQKFLAQLHILKEKCGATHWEDGYLAKGELHGSSAPLWRSRGPILKGVGFNYDFPDERKSKHEKGVPILKEGDILVTSGLDGVFPAGLLVGTVQSIEPLKEGDFSYNIEVRPAANHLNDLQTVFVLPSLYRS
jgi:cell shape-determining protein MreC